MRLIDADALERKVLEWMPSDPCGIEEKEIPFETDIVVSLMMEIEEVPTIELVEILDVITEYLKSTRSEEDNSPTIHTENKKGRWIADRYCSECEWDKKDAELVCNIPTNYCPNCGAKIKGENNE